MYDQFSISHATSYSYTLDLLIVPLIASHSPSLALSIRWKKKDIFVEKSIQLYIVIDVTQMLHSN